MPYRWTETPAEKTLDLWPHQSMTPRGFTWFMGLTSALLALPRVARLGAPVVWVLMAFFLATLGSVWWALRANVTARQSREALTMAPGRVHLAHLPARGPALEWEANPHWVTVHLREDGPVEKYLTLRGNGREVELGSFLSPEEREGLFSDLSRLLR